MCMTAQMLSAETWRRKIAGKYIVEPASGCWIWTGKRDKHGYGGLQANLGGRLRNTGAHRASWIAHRGPITTGLTIDHLCRNSKCINPDHMEPVSNRENIRRGWRDCKTHGRRSRGELSTRPGCRTHGKSSGGWVKRKNGYMVWVCTICQRERMNRWKDKMSR